MSSINDENPIQEEGRNSRADVDPNWELIFQNPSAIRIFSFDNAVDFVNEIHPKYYHFSHNLSAKSLIWKCKDFENCPFLLKMVPEGDVSGLSPDMIKKGYYCFQEVHDHNHSRETLMQGHQTRRSIESLEEVKDEIRNLENTILIVEDDLASCSQRSRRVKYGTKLRTLRQQLLKVNQKLAKLQSRREGGEEVPSDISLDAFCTRQLLHAKKQMEQALKKLPSLKAGFMKEWSPMCERADKSSNPSTSKPSDNPKPDQSNQPTVEKKCEEEEEGEKEMDQEDAESHPEIMETPALIRGMDDCMEMAFGGEGELPLDPSFSLLNLDEGMNMNMDMDMDMGIGMNMEMGTNVEMNMGMNMGIEVGINAETRVTNDGNGEEEADGLPIQDINSPSCEVLTNDEHADLHNNAKIIDLTMDENPSILPSFPSSSLPEEVAMNHESHTEKRADCTDMESGETSSAKRVRVEHPSPSSQLHEEGEGEELEDLAVESDDENKNEKGENTMGEEEERTRLAENSTKVITIGDNDDSDDDDDDSDDDSDEGKKRKKKKREKKDGSFPYAQQILKALESIYFSKSVLSPQPVDPYKFVPRTEDMLDIRLPYQERSEIVKSFKGICSESKAHQAIRDELDNKMDAPISALCFYYLRKESDFLYLLCISFLPSFLPSSFFCVLMTLIMGRRRTYLASSGFANHHTK